RREDLDIVQIGLSSSISLYYRKCNRMLCILQGHVLVEQRLIVTCAASVHAVVGLGFSVQRHIKAGEISMLLNIHPDAGSCKCITEGCSYGTALCFRTSMVAVRFARPGAPIA